MEIAMSKPPRATARKELESEGRLRSLLENIPDIVCLVDRSGVVQFANRDTDDVTRNQLQGAVGFEFIVPEHREECRAALEGAFAGAMPQTVEAQDIFGRWWRIRAASLAKEGDSEHTIVICTDITQERLATEAVEKEQQLLRQLLELHEGERKLIAYEIHDGFAQQLTGALYRLQAFREAFARDPAEAWKGFDAGLRLITHAIDETRRLISGLRPPILDESGIIQAIEYLIYEHQRHDGPAIEFVHDVAFERLAPPLESAIFRIVQESLQNARQHSRSDKVHLRMSQRGDRIHIDIRDCGVGFSAEKVEERRFGLQGIRERVRLLDGNVVINSAPGKGTHIRVELPLVDHAGLLRDDIEPDDE
jgi:PAS domain S-box-containing protein